MAHKVLLDLDALAQVERPLVQIDGQKYELAVPQDFGLKDEAELRAIQKTIQVVGEGPLEAEQIEQIAQAIDKFVAKVLPDLPAETRAKLKDQQKVQILVVFSEEAKRRQPGLQEVKPEEIPAH